MASIRAKTVELAGSSSEEVYDVTSAWTCERDNPPSICFYLDTNKDYGVAYEISVKVKDLIKALKRAKLI